MGIFLVLRLGVCDASMGTNWVKPTASRASESLTISAGALQLAGGTLYVWALTFLWGLSFNCENFRLWARSAFPLRLGLVSIRRIASYAFLEATTWLQASLPIVLWSPVTPSHVRFGMKILFIIELVMGKSSSYSPSRCHPRWGELESVGFIHLALALYPDMEVTLRIQGLGSSWPVS